ncbi:MAG TPA: helix-turn-helix transcriptional regulator [Gemmatimonadales bacterium]
MPAHQRLSSQLPEPEPIAVVCPNRHRRTVWHERLKQCTAVAVVGVWSTVEEAQQAGVPLAAILYDVSPAAQRARRRGLPDLSPREAQVMALLAGGCRDKELPGLLGVSAHTARTYLRRAMSKLGAGSRAEAVVLWSRLEHQ